MTRSDFLTAAWPLAQLVSLATGIDPRLVMAQAILETGWGEHAPDNNYFGVKGPGGSFMTTEFVNGSEVHVPQSFAGYRTMADSFLAYARLMQTDRYRLIGTARDLYAQIVELGCSGYATDPAYGSKVASIADQLTVPA